jgi:hypothetical protein
MSMVLDGTNNRKVGARQVVGGRSRWIRCTYAWVGGERDDWLGSLYWLQVMRDNGAGSVCMRSVLALCALGVYLFIDWVYSVHCLRNLSVYCSFLADVSDDWSY